MVDLLRCGGAVMATQCVSGAHSRVHNADVDSKDASEINHAALCLQREEADVLFRVGFAVGERRCVFK